MSEGNTYGVEQKSAASHVSSLSRASFESTDPIGRGMMTTAERKATLWHSRKTLGANTGSAETRTTGIGQSMNRAEGTN
jgi:hypothetical protein